MSPMMNCSLAFLCLQRQTVQHVWQSARSGANRRPSRKCSPMGPGVIFF